MSLTLRQARLLSDLTQKQVADLLGVHTHTYMKWERNPEEMTIRTAKEISKIFKVDLEEIFFKVESN
ncbi:helix-turn-helix transcriptional regulator [Terrihalobacillus insolitus]|uniref:helix-turn-helix transcriptional regulator n=1 Tax=Terrihalobacillus insolitus TaxID=2950438 RepID=UPI002340C913|nr:helix-turn-helix transcriptional regulator [Terrihalobacillus insolitus]MDC3414305.1 helix-turn-helix domain-containing protein [Terrihalobacillus insolitus]